jgi:hypothetical protein
MMNQLIIFHKLNKKMKSEKKMNHFISQTKHTIKEWIHDASPYFIFDGVIHETNTSLMSVSAHIFSPLNLALPLSIYQSPAQNLCRASDLRRPLEKENQSDRAGTGRQWQLTWGGGHDVWNLEWY